MKQIFLTLTVISLIACNQDECCEKPIIIGGEHQNCTHDTVVVDSLQNVGELLNYLETIPSTHR